MNVLIRGDTVYIKSGREDSVKKETASLSLECRGGSRGIGKTGPHKAGVPWKNGISMLNSGTVEESLTSAYRGGKKWKYNERLCPPGVDADKPSGSDRKSTRLNSSHVAISYAVFCLKKKKAIKI